MHACACVWCACTIYTHILSVIEFLSCTLFIIHGDTDSQTHTKTPLCPPLWNAAPSVVVEMSGPVGTCSEKPPEDRSRKGVSTNSVGDAATLASSFAKKLSLFSQRCKRRQTKQLECAATP